MTGASAAGRLVLLDLARTMALVAMATYHFVYDLEMFGYVAPYTALAGPWAIFARTVAASFLCLVGISLYLAHGQGIRWHKFWPRLAMIAAAAVLITIATRYALGERFIYFGILHSIAFASLTGLAFLRLPPVVLLAVAAGIAALPQLYRFEAASAPWLVWLGLGTTPSMAADFVPVFPWFAPVLLGIATARILTITGALARIAAFPTSRRLRALSFPGRHSLAFYLIHQPVLIGLLACFNWVTRG